MMLPRPEDALHRGMLYRLLIEIADTALLSKSLIFKGGTCAALINELDRFSIDLDFDLSPMANVNRVRDALEKSFLKLNFTIKDQSIRAIQYTLKYDAPEHQRNTLQIDAVNTAYQSDEYEPLLLRELEPCMVCQTIETMVAHKLVAVIDRYNKHHAIAGRDLYDIHYFFIHGKRYNENVIRERTGEDALAYITKLTGFIQKNITSTIINEDLNMLLPFEKFSAIRKSLKQEVVSILLSEIEKLKRLN